MQNIIESELFTYCEASLLHACTLLRGDSKHIPEFAYCF